MRPDPRMIRRFLAILAATVAGGLFLVVASSCQSLTIGQKALRPAPAASLVTTAPAQQPPAAMPMHEDCTACHVKDNQLVKGKPMPVIPHQVSGWEECSFCHSEGRLAPMPVRHAGAPDDQCQTCHKAGTVPPPLMAHLNFKDKSCVSCHGPVVGLPVSHNDRPAYACDLCHQIPASGPPAAPHPATQAQKCGTCHKVVATVPHSLMQGEKCGTCHTGERALSLTPAHAGRSEQLCTLCHQERKGGTPGIPHSIENRGRCTDCHAPGKSPPSAGAGGGKLVQ